MTWALIAICIAAGIAIGYAIASRKTKRRFLAFAEYWVYLPGDKMPAQDALMKRMINTNPYHRRGVSPVGTQEGLLFSDIRLHVALVLKARNVHIFRPDLFDEHIEPTKEILRALSDAASLVKLRYVSEQPLPDKRHLQFLIHAADAVAELGDGKVIFDPKAEMLLSRDELQEMLRENFDATGPDLHTKIVWRQAGETAVAETRGLIKIGLPELRTGRMSPDERVLGISVLTETVKSVWESAKVPESLEVSSFGDTFRVLFEPLKNKATMVRILRVQAS